MRGEVQLLKKQFGQVRTLVGRHDQKGATRRQPLQRLDHPFERLGAVRDMGGVIDQEALEQLLRLRALDRRPRRFEHVHQQRPRARADQGGGRLHRHRRQTFFDQQPIQGPDQIRRRIDQRPIQIEGDGPAFQVAIGHPHLPLARRMG